MSESSRPNTPEVGGDTRCPEKLVQRDFRFDVTVRCQGVQGHDGEHWVLKTGCEPPARLVWNPTDSDGWQAS